MRVIIIAVLVVAAWGGCLIKVETRKLERLYRESTSMMSSDVERAVEHFEETKRISDLQTLGKASTRRKAFFFELAAATERRLVKTEFAGHDGKNVIVALEAIRNTAELDASESIACQQQILEKMGDAKALLAAKGHLSNFDAYVGFLNDLNKFNPLDPSLSDQLAPMIRAARAVDRYPIAHRTTLHIVQAGIDRGLEDLGLSRVDGQRFAQARFGQKSAVWPPEAAGKAESHFRPVAETVDRFMNQWRPPAVPPDLQWQVAAAAHNEAMTRVAYSLATLRRGKRWERYFLPEFRPQGGVNERELRANWLVGISQLLAKALAKAQALGPDEAGKAELLQSVHYARAQALANFWGKAAEANQAMGSFRGLGGQAPPGAPGQSPARFLFFY